jgi:hypothetical protein
MAIFPPIHSTLVEFLFKELIERSFLAVRIKAQKNMMKLLAITEYK